MPGAGHLRRAPRRADSTAADAARAKSLDRIQAIIAAYPDPPYTHYFAFDPDLPRPAPPLRYPDLEELATLIDMKVCEWLTDENISTIIPFISKFIVRDLTDVPIIAGPASMQHSEFLACHRIAVTIIRSIGQSRIAQFISDAFLHGLVTMLGSPDRREQDAIQSILDSIVDVDSDTSPRIAAVMERRLKLIAAGVSSWHAARPLIEFLGNYFRDPSHLPAKPDWFVRAVLPLFSSDGLSTFYNRLRQLCLDFYGLFDQLPAVALLYLFRHWPITASGKLPHFVNHVGDIVSLLSDSGLNGAAEGLCRRLRSAFEFGAQDGVIEVLRFLANSALLARIEPEVRRRFFPAVVRQIDAQRNSWHPDVARIAEQLIQKINDADPTLAQLGDAAQEPETFGNWIGICEGVKQDHPEVAASFEAQIVLARGRRT
jgi:hypothetical protein